MGWLPEIAREVPATRLGVRYRVTSAGPLPYSADHLAEALRAARLTGREIDEHSWEVRLPMPTLVFGMIPALAKETVAVRIVTVSPGREVQLDCLPQKTHNAHAKGMAAILLLAAAVWLVGGWLAGLRAGITVAVLGTLCAVSGREVALRLLERRLCRLAESLGTALWSGQQAQVTCHRIPEGRWEKS